MTNKEIAAIKEQLSGENPEVTFNASTSKFGMKAMELKFPEFELTFVEYPFPDKKCMVLTNDPEGLIALLLSRNASR